MKKSLPRWWFEWRNQRYPVIRALRTDGGETVVLECPQCGNGIPFDKDKHTANDKEMWLPHTLSFSETGGLTASPSVVCPYNCGWHVTITNGVAA